jgi:hypothetical protein
MTADRDDPTPLQGHPATVERRAVHRQHQPGPQRQGFCVLPGKYSLPGSHGEVEAIGRSIAVDSGRCC